jgi:hypothetical protein
MSAQTSSDALALSRRILRLLTALNLLMGVLILALLVASLIAEEPVMRALGISPGPDSASLIVGGRLIMVFGIVAVPITHLVLTRLREIVETVKAGDPFVVDNAARLRMIAWSLLALEVLHLVIVAVAANASTPTTPLDVGADFSVTRWLAVILLFVLARVFETGARMREDLEGTV